ncbi:hypothetical protein [Ottowia oryzae]|nr:hypothetical protein [Ottowia oryzae]
MAPLIDCHVLTLPGDNPAWRAELERDLAAQPVCQHWIAGIPGQIGAARAAGFALGDAPFVSFADPDDRIMGGVFAKLLQALQEKPDAPFAWAGEQRVGADLTPIGRAAVWPEGYDQRRHRNYTGAYCHGVVLIRRSVLAPALPALRACHVGAEGVLLAHLAGVHAPIPPGREPVHLPIVGRFWREHRQAVHHTFTPADRARNSRALGFEPQYLHTPRRPPAAPCATCGPPRR